MWPTVIRKEENVEKAYDLVSCLLKDRIILLSEEINNNTATSIIAQLLFLDAESNEPITMYISSPGGSVDSGLAIYDVMHSIKSPVKTVAVGMAASMAAFLLSSGTPGMRYALPNSTVMVHQPLGGAQGQATEIQIVAKRILFLREKMYKIMAHNCHSDFDTIAEACERDNYLTAEQALKMGFIDKIVETTSKV